MAKRSRESSISSSGAAEDSPITAASESPRPAKLNVVDDCTEAETVMQCSLPPHREPLSFTSIESFEVHYAKEHSNRCNSCNKNFPTAHFLNLHIDEHHNAFREALEAKGEKTYGCFVEDCEKKCSSPQKRRLHLIDKHLFPRVYNFRIIEIGIDKSTSMLHEGRRRRISTTFEQSKSSEHRRRSSLAVIHPKSGNSSSNQAPPKSLPTMNKNENPLDDGVQDLEKSMSALKFVPPSVQRNKQPPG
jgi:hypothetical protein